jgi:uncharacterized membrane protein
MSKSTQLSKQQVHKLVGIALLGAIVVVLQLIGQYIRVGPVSISLVLIPIVVGSAVYGPSAGGILGFIFSIVVLCQPDTNAFYAVTVPGTISTVVTKGVCAGIVCGGVYRWIASKNSTVAVAVAAIVSPFVNTGIFALGCRLFFWDFLAQLGGGNALLFLITGMIGFNFLVELGVNILTAPAIVRLIRLGTKK